MSSFPQRRDYFHQSHNDVSLNPQLQLMPGHFRLLVFLGQQAKKGLILLLVIIDCDYKVATRSGKELAT